jgi:dTDP-4-dehydrorhamnose 3,5-epimerase
MRHYSPAPPASGIMDPGIVANRRSIAAMQFIATDIEGPVIIEPDVHRDARGFFLETYHAEKYRDGGINALFVQDNQSRSAGNILRGLHGQLRHPQGKLIRVIEGEVYDVAVDLRRNSPTFGRHVATRLSAENFRQFFIPPGFAHGFCVLSDAAQIEYKCTDFYRPDDEFAVAWNDPEIGISWPVAEPVLSERDRNAPPLAEMIERL